jgi:nitrogen-specific signal transduction histidine kinase
VKSLNHHYRGKESLKQFIDDHKIVNAPNLLIQVFTGVIDHDYIKELIRELNEYCDEAHIIGATTDGEINGSQVTTEKTVISFTVFEKTVMRQELISTQSEAYDSFELGESIAMKVVDAQTRVMITFGTGLDINGEEYLKGVEEHSNDIVVAGGLAGDNGEFSHTYVFDNHTITSSGVVAVTLQSEVLRIVTGYSFNWMKIGKELTITKSDQNRVYTIDGMSAKETYRKYLGDEIAKRLPAIGVEFPLIIKKDGINIARAVLNAHDDGSLVFAGNINEGDKVQFGVGNADLILSESSKKFKEFQGSSIQSIFVYSCMARRRFLQESVELELEPLTSIAPVSGFFTYGEFFTNSIEYINVRKNELLNETMTILGLSEGESEDYDQEFVPSSRQSDEFAKTLSALSNLINVSTKEIDELNCNLEKRVEEEVEKNKVKDSMMQRQTRMAQMGEMLSMIAHQWRQPLSTISTISANLELESSLGMLDDNVLIGELKAINEQTQFLSQTINDFRNFFNPNKAKEQTKVVDLIDKTLEIIIKSVENRGIELERKYQRSDVKVQTYPNEVMQVLLNIVKNASDVILERDIREPKIIIDCYDEGEMCVINVCDNAGGIPEDIIEKIFDPYFSTKSEKNGTGLGLYMSRTIINEHCNGSFTADNTNDGARFTIKLPIE